MNATNISAKQLEELEDFFNNNTIPQVIKLHGAITYTNVPGFVRNNLALLKNDQLKGFTATVRLDDLLDLKKAIEEKIVEG